MKQKKPSPLKDMTLKEKVEHIWEYYRIHIFITLFILFFTGSMINHLFINPPKQAGVFVGFIGKYLDMEQAERVQEILTKEIVQDPTEETEAKVDHFMINPDSPELMEISMANTQKLMAMLASREIDIIVANSFDFNEYIQQQAFIPLTELFTKEELKQWEELWLQGKTEEDRIAKIYGIYLWDNPIVEELRFVADKPVIGIVSNTERVEKAKETLKWFLNRQIEK